MLQGEPVDSNAGLDALVGHDLQAVSRMVAVHKAMRPGVYEEMRFSVYDVARLHTIAGPAVPSGPILQALSAFYQHAARHRVDLGELLTSWQPARGAASWKPFLHHISKSRPSGRRAVSLKVPRKHPRVLTAAEAQTILDACGRLRDRLLFALLYDSGIRIGEALGLRHEDIAAADRQITIRARVNGNGARAKSALTRVIPVSAELIRLLADYLHEEYGDLDSDYVFVNLWGSPHGHPLGYPAVYDLVRWLRRATGIDFDPHWWRHTYATRLLRDGAPVEVVSKLLGHASVTTTLSCYGHLTVEDARTPPRSGLVHQSAMKCPWFDGG